MNIVHKMVPRFMSMRNPIGLAFLVLVFCASASRAQTNTFPSSGNTGVGTTTPSTLLYLGDGSAASNPVLTINGGTNDGKGAEIVLRRGGSNAIEIGFSSAVIGDGNNDALYYTNGSGAVHRFYTSGSERVRIDSSGNVGIGKPDPSYKLDVNGTISGTNVIAKFQDVAEWVPASEHLAAGTVVVLDANKSNQVTSSSTSYDTRVAGVVTAQPGIALGEKSDGKVLVATTGRVRVKVDATKSPIHIGDLLVTSGIPGVAMKSEPINLGGVEIHRPGTLIGKALEPLEKGKGEILVLLSLQ